MDHAAGDRIFYWDLDKAKFSKGSWKRGRVLATDGPMVTVEHEGGVQRINESEIRRDHDPWHDHPLPPILEEGRTLNPSEGTPPEESPEEKGEGPHPALGEYAADSFWLVKTKGQGEDQLPRAFQRRSRSQ